MTAKREGGLLQEALTRSVIRSFFDVHTELGFGFREHIYALAMERHFVATGHKVEREVAVLIHFRGEPLARQTLDMIVDERLVIETKATERLHPDARRQLFGYLCSTSLELGLLLHFGREARFYRVICENHLKPHYTTGVS
jgi:GxxExxY protein